MYGRDRGGSSEVRMRVMAIYVFIVLIVETIAVMVGLQLDDVLPVISVPLALVLFFGALSGGWYLAVYITERWFPDPVEPALPLKARVG
jgi:hypothetical protein